MASILSQLIWDKNALLIFDISNPADPQLFSKLKDKRLGNPNRCIITKNRAYLPMVKGNGVAVVDISDKKNPHFLKAYQSPLLNKTYGIALRENLIFVGAREGNSFTVMNRIALEK